MNYLIAAAFAAAALATGAQAAKPAPKLLAPINQFIDSFDKGDMAGAAATHMADVTIIDEVPPHMWRGPKALETWAGDLMADDKKNGMSGEKVTLGKPVRQVVSGDKGYVVIRATFSYKQNGVDMVEPAQMTFALQTTKEGWKISAWAWDGTVPKPATPAAAPAK
jgi:hypothetical protein